MGDPGKLAAKLLQKNFKKFGSFRTTCTYESVANSIYTPSTQNVAPQVAGTQTGVKFVFADFNLVKKMGNSQPDGEKILSVDKQAVIPSLDLDYVPKAGDRLTTSAGLIWRVMGVGDDPKPAHYALHIRPANHA